MNKVVIKTIELAQPEYSEKYEYWKQKVGKNLTNDEFLEILFLRSSTRFIIETINSKLDTHFTHSDYVANDFMKFLVTLIQKHTTVENLNTGKLSVSYELHINYEAISL